MESLASWVGMHFSSMRSILIAVTSILPDCILALTSTHSLRSGSCCVHGLRQELQLQLR